MIGPPITEFNLLHASICRALADPKRILILYALNDDPRNVSCLAEDLNIPQPTVSRHLGVLRRQSLVYAERQGTSVIYHLADRRIIQVLDMMGQIMRDAMVHQSGLIRQAGR